MQEPVRFFNHRNNLNSSTASRMFKEKLKKTEELKFELNFCGFGIIKQSRFLTLTPPRKLIVEEGK